MFGEEGFDVFGKSEVVVRGRVWGVAVVARVDCVDGAGEVAGEDAETGGKS